MNSVKKYSFDSLIFFLISPFLTIFMQFYSIARGSRFALNLFIIILGLIGYIYVPFWTNDKTRFFERYEQMKSFNFQQFLDNLIVTKRPDFIFESFIFLFSYLDINIQLLFFVVNTFCVYSIFKVTDLMTGYFISNKRFLCFAFVLFSLALQHLYSGIRFTLGTSFFLWAIYFLDFKKNKKLGILLFIITCFTHFSLLLYVLLYTVYKMNLKINYKYIFILSLLFIFVSKEFLSLFFNSLPLTESYANKVDIYVNGGDIATINAANESSVIIYFIKNLWIYLAYFVLLIQKDSNKKVLQLLFLFFAILNIFYSFPSIFSRYLILCKYLFTIFLISQYLVSKKNVYFNIFLFLYFLTFAIDCYLMRINFAETFKAESIWNLYSILTREVNLESVINNK